MPSTFLVSDLSNSQFGQLPEPFSPLQNATLTFLGCPSRHTEINLNFDLIQALSPGATVTGNLAGNNLSAQCEETFAHEGNRMSKSPKLSSHQGKKTHPEPTTQPIKKEILRNQTFQSVENTRCCREAKNTSLERGESQRKNINDERMSMFHYESSFKNTENAPRRAASLDKNSHTSTEGMPQRKRSRERTTEVTAFSRLRTCLKGLEQKSQEGQLMETQISNRVLEQKAALNMHRQMRLPKAQGDMEIQSKGAESFKHMTEKPVDSNGVLVDSNIQNYAGSSVEKVNTAEQQCHSPQKSRTRGYPTIDKMFIDVLKTLIMQSGPESGSGITSIYDSRETGETCTYKVESEIGKSNNAVAMIASGDDCETGENQDETWSHEGAHGGVVSGSDKNIGSIRCDGDKNCNHSVVGYDEHEDDKLAGLDSEQIETPEVLYDVFYQDTPGNTVENLEAQWSKEYVGSTEIQCKSNATRTKCRDSMTNVTYPNHLPEALGNALNGWEAIRFSYNHNNSINDNDDSETTSSSGLTKIVTTDVDKNRQGHAFTDQSQEQSLGQDHDIVIKLTPPSPPSSRQDLMLPPVSSSALDKNVLLSVPEVYMSLRARLPSTALLEMVADERFGANNGVEKELEDLCGGNGSGVPDLHNRPNSSQISRNFIIAYIERAKEVLRKVRARPVSPQNVLDKVNKYCEKVKNEAKLIKSWSFSETVTPFCNGGMHRSAIGKFRFTDFKGRWDTFQDGYTSFKAEDAQEKKMTSARPGDAHSPIFCLNSRVAQNDAAYHIQVESLDIPGSSQSYAAATSSCRPQPVIGQASAAADECRILKGRENIQESSAADGSLNSRPDLYECCERKSAFLRYGEASTEINVAPYPRHRDTREALLEINEEEAMPSGQHPCGSEELVEFKLDPVIQRDHPTGVECSASMLTSLSCSHVQRDIANIGSTHRQGVFLKSVPLKSQSLFQVGRETQGGTSEVMSMISQEVTIKRYPSFADLTDLSVDSHQKPDASSVEAKPTSVQSIETESYAQTRDEQTLTKFSMTLTNVTPVDDCPELELVGQSAEEADTEKLTPPNSPDLGVLVGARVQTIVSLLESCSALRSDSERAPNQPVHLEPNSRSTPCQLKQFETERNSPGIPDGRPNEISLPSPPATSPGDSTSDTLDDVVFPLETYDHCIASTSKSATARQHCFKVRQMPLKVVISSNGDEFEKHTHYNTCDDHNEEILYETFKNTDAKVLDSFLSTEPQTKTTTETYFEEYPSRSRRDICEPMGIVTCKESDSFSLSASDSDLHLKEVCSQDILSDEEEYLEQDKDVEIMQPAQPKGTTKPRSSLSMRAGDAGQIVKTHNSGLKTRTEKRLVVGSNERHDAQSSNAELKHKTVSKARALHTVEPGETGSAKIPGKIKWVTESPSDDDDVSSPTPISDSCNWTLKTSKDKALPRYPTQSMRVAQSDKATSGQNSGTPDKRDFSKLYSHAPENKTDDNSADTAGGSKSDSNNNVSTPTGNRWIRLHKGIPFNLKVPKTTAKQAPDSNYRKSDAGSKDKLPASTILSKRQFRGNGVNVDGMRKAISLSEVSQVIGVADPEDAKPDFLSKLSNVSIISKDDASINKSDCHLAANASPVDFPEEEEGVRDYGEAKSNPHCSVKREDSFVVDQRKVAHSNPQVLRKPYQSVRREETFSSDPRKVAHSKPYEARSSQSLQLHDPVIPVLPPRPIRCSYYTRGLRCWKRSDAVGALFFDKTSPDVSPEARDIGTAVKGETCVVPKLSKCLWEGTTNLLGRENTKEQIDVTSPSPQNLKRLRSRLQRFDAKAPPKARDFIHRSSVQIDRCDKMIKKSTNTIRASQAMVERSRRRLASTADEMRLLASKYISIF